MSTYLHHIETWSPPCVYTQEEAAERVGAQFDDPKLRRIVRHVYRQTAIDQRHTCVPFGEHGALFANDERGKWHNPGTGERNQAYVRVSREVAPALAGKTLGNSGFLAGDITHVITVSCTGFYNPGPDVDIVRGLELSPSVQRFHLGFMGCQAVFPALRLADSLCAKDPHAVVLILALELCSLHVQVDEEQLQAGDMDSLVAASLFADGAGCALVSARAPAPGRRALRLLRLGATLTPDGADAMAWTVGNHGFEIVLSSYVPHILGANIRNAVTPFLEAAHQSLETVRHWVVHPGGKAIIDQVEQALDLPSPALDGAREVLREHGNMSSATLLFLLRDLLQGKEQGLCAAMAFGPGLTVEMGLLDLLPAREEPHA